VIEARVAAADADVDPAVAEREKAHRQWQGLEAVPVQPAGDAVAVRALQLDDDLEVLLLGHDRCIARRLHSSRCARCRSSPVL
jgi:hypothetical protein